MVADFQRRCYHISTVPVKEYLEVIGGAGVRAGLLVFFIDGISQQLLAMKGSKVTLTCRGVANNLISTPTYEFTGINEGHRHYPGLE